MTYQSRSLHIISLICMLWLFAACGMPSTGSTGSQEPPSASTPDAITPQPAAPLENTTWVLVMYGPADKRAQVLAKTEVNITFAADGKISGSSGCNSYAGNFSRTGQSFTTSELLHTERGCFDTAAQEQENVYLAALQGATAIQQAGDSLTIEYAGGQLVFAKQIAAPAAALTGTNWQLDTITTGESASSLVAGSTITAQFADGRVSGSAGCNQYSASYTLAGETLKVGPVILTKMACDTPLLDQEQEFIKGLEAATKLIMNGNTLELVHPAGSLVWRTGN